MARPTKQTVDYFSHDCDMRNDIKIKALRRKYKHLGYSIYIITLELLGDTEYFQIKWDDTNIELLASEYDCDTDILKEVIDYCIQLDLFQIDYGYLHCKQFTKRLEDTLLVRRKDYCSNNSPISKLRRVNVNNNRQTKLNETKLNKSILDDSIVNKSEEDKILDEYYEEAYDEILNEQAELEEYYEYMDEVFEKREEEDKAFRKDMNQYMDKAISYSVAKKLLADLCDWSLSFSMFEEALEEMNSIGFSKLCMLAQISEAEIAKVKECVSIRVEQQS